MAAFDEFWVTPARTLVLYNPKGEWRYAVYSEVGVADGQLLDTPGTALPDVAQARLVEMVESWSGVRYRATWSSERDYWWSAELTVDH